jgi:hypothetical protein
MACLVDPAASYDTPGTTGGASIVEWMDFESIWPLCKWERYILRPTFQQLPIHTQSWSCMMQLHTLNAMLLLLLLKSRFFKNRELYWSNLPQNSNCAWELVQKSGVQIPVGEGQIFLSCFLFIFIFFIKNWILTHKILFFKLLLAIKYQ